MNQRRRHVRQIILRWYRRPGRDLPWRRTRDPYAILVSEVMLQQTQVDRVRPKYRTWLRAFPTVRRLARAPLRPVMRLWSGLGYNRRAVYLRAAARAIMTAHHGQFPKTLDELKRLPGVGVYTAGAIATFAFGQRVGLIDTNVRRVISRVFFGVAGPTTERQLRRRVATIVPTGRTVSIWHHAVMDLGALICTSRRPACQRCPVRLWCRAYPSILRALPTSPSVQPPFSQSDRFWRGRIVRLMTAAGTYTEQQLLGVLRVDGRMTTTRFHRLLVGLVADGLLRRRGQHLQLAA